MYIYNVYVHTNAPHVHSSYMHYDGTDRVVTSATRAHNTLKLSTLIHVLLCNMQHMCIIHVHVCSIFFADANRITFSSPLQLYHTTTHSPFKLQCLLHITISVYHFNHYVCYTTHRQSGKRKVKGRYIS